MVPPLQPDLHLPKTASPLHHVQPVPPPPQQPPDPVPSLPKLLHHDVRPIRLPIPSTTKEHHREGQRTLCVPVGGDDDVLH